MMEISFHRESPPHWSRLTTDHRKLFGCDAWQNLLRAGLGGESIYCMAGSSGAVITVFRAGLFRIGYLGFPTGELVGNGLSRSDVVENLAASNSSNGMTCLRIPVSPFSDPESLDLPFISNLETAITDLPHWHLAGVSKRLRRDIRKAERSGLAVARLADPGQAGYLHEQYVASVRRHGGAVRYSRAYFDDLARLSLESPTVRILLAQADHRVAGFVVTVSDGDIAYYLHGGSDPDYRQASPSDLLLKSAIEGARDDGLRIFNLMASPADQPNLVRYKEKWGGITREHRTYTRALSAKFAAFRLAEKFHGLVRQIR